MDQATVGAVSSTIDGVKAISADVSGGDGSNSGKLIGGAAADAAVVVGTVGAGTAVGKGVAKLSSTIGKTSNTASKTMSPNVEKVVNSLKQVESSGGTVKPNRLKSNQQLNMTIEKGGSKINVRVENHVVEPKYGGNGKTSQNHMNVDYYKNGRRKTNDHTILE